MYISTPSKKVSIYLLFQRCLLRFFTGLFCVASITNNCMLNLLPVFKYERMPLLSFTPDHALCLRGKHLMVLGVHS